MSLSRFTRGLISSHISARSTPLWDQIEVAMMEPETEKKRKRTRRDNTKTITSIPDTAVIPPPRDNKPETGRADASQTAARPSRAERRSALRQAWASRKAAVTDELIPDNSTIDTGCSVGGAAERDNRVYANTLGGAGASLLLPNTTLLLLPAPAALHGTVLPSHVRQTRCHQSLTRPAASRRTMKCRGRIVYPAASLRSTSARE